MPKKTNREIKFKYFYSGKMIDVGQMEFFTDETIHVNEELFGGVLLQFTGLKDKNGKEIYQSDLLKKNNFDGVWEVIWNDDSPGYFITNGKIRMPMSKLCQPLVEIVGNVYES